MHPIFPSHVYEAKGKREPPEQQTRRAKQTTEDIGVLFGGLVEKSRAIPGLPGGLIIYQGTHVFPPKGHL